MSKSTKKIENEVQALKQELSSITSALISKKDAPMPNSDAGISALLKYMTEERERTNKILASITSKISNLEEELRSTYTEESSAYETAGRRQVPVSGLDAKILNFIQTKDMVCADQVRDAMGYKGRNAACSRLNKLYKQGIIERFQLGHKVYYKYDAGRATDILIISPPQ
jgi:hypothetical protein